VAECVDGYGSTTVGPRPDPRQGKETGVDSEGRVIRMRSPFRPPALSPIRQATLL